MLLKRQVWRVVLKTLAAGVLLSALAVAAAILRQP